MLQSITLNATFEELPKLSAWVAAQAPLNARQTYAIQLCLEELGVNLVLHGRPQGGNAVRFTVTLETEPLCVTVEDDGVAFDPTDAPAQAASPTLESVTAGGLGLNLINGFATQREYERIAGKNRSVLSFGEGA